MANKYLSQNGGRIQEVEASTASSGAADSGKLVALDTAGKIDNTMLRDVEAITMTAGEALVSGDVVYIDTSGEVRKAVADAAGTEANGFVLSSVASGASLTVYFEGKLVTTGLTVGKKYYLSHTVAGDLLSEDDTLPSASGAVIQYIGKAVSATELMFEPDGGIILA